MPRKNLTAALVAALTLTTVGSLLPATPARASVADSVPDRTFVTDGPVNAVVRSGGTIYIGGSFTSVGPRTGPGVEVAPDGSDRGLPEVSGGGGTVNAVAPDGFGGWYIGGLFTHVGGLPRGNIAHIRADRSVDPAFVPDANGGVHALAVAGATLYAGGLFTSIGGQGRNRIAGLNLADGTATAFDPDADASVVALAISGSGSTVYAGGSFRTIGGLPRRGLAALDTVDGSAVPTFDPTCDGTVQALAISGGSLYVGGFFKVIGGAARSNIAALHAGGPLDGTAVPTFNPNANSGATNIGAGGVSALAVARSGSTVYAGGLFTNIGGQNRRYFAALDAADGTATAFDPNPNSNVLGIALSDDDATVYAAGGFISVDGLPSIGGQARNRLAAINAADGTATAFDPNLNGAGTTVAVSGSAIYVGGGFSSIGGVVRRGIAAIDAADGTATSFDPGARWGTFNGTVYALAVSGTTVYAGGFFTSIGGQPRNYIAALDAATGAATGWNPGAGAQVRTLLVSGSLIYAAGSFTTIGGQPRSYIAALNLSDGSVTGFNANANGIVNTMAVSGDLLYVGGSFTVIGGQSRNKIAALVAADGSATDWNPDATINAAVAALAVSGTTIYVGGEFVTIGGQARKNIAALNAGDGTATAFDPQANDAVRALTLSDSTLYAGGLFSEIGGQTRALIAGLDLDGTVTGFDPGATPGSIASVLTVTPDGTLYAGGSFRTFDLAFQQGFASFAGPAPNLPPTAGVSATPTSGVTPLAVSFDASTSSDPDSGDTIASYTFDFGDGSAPLTQTDATTSHTYTASGTHAATVTATDSRGLQSTNTASVPIQVSPAAPVITTPAPGAALNASSVTIAGTTEASLTVEISDGGTVLETTVADASGAFSITYAFADGPHAITATATEGSGNTGPASAVRSFTVDTVAPDAPAIATPAEDVTFTDSSVALSGISEPGATVTLREDARLVVAVQADASGVWSAAAGFTNGAHAVIATATDAAGNTGSPSASRAFDVADVSAPAAPMIGTPAQDATVDAASVVVSGTAEPGASVQLHEGSAVVGSTPVNAAGTWRAVLFGLPAGAHTITAIATDPAGNVGAASTPRSFTVTASAAPVLTIASPGHESVQPGYVAFTGTGGTPGTAVALVEGEVRLGTVMPASNGSWTMGLSLPTGAHSVVATSPGVTASRPVGFTVDADPPAVSVTTPQRSLFLPGDAVRITGTAADNRSVVGVSVTYFDVFNRQVAKQMATCVCAPGASQVSWTASPTLPSGFYTAVAQSVDEAGNRSPVRSTTFVSV